MVFLAQDRAQSVKQALEHALSQLGVRRELTAVGHGQRKCKCVCGVWLAACTRFYVAVV